MEREYNHDACADLLLVEFGIGTSLRDELIVEIKKIWDAVDMPHFAIIRSVRGYLPLPQTIPLERWLDQRKTHTALHGKVKPTVQSNT